VAKYAVYFDKIDDIIFLAAQSEIVFEHGEISKIIAIPIMNDLEAEKDESFAVELYDPTGGAQLGKHTRTVVTIINDDGKRFFLEKLFS
jgi:solute carrier family 8 (sodium/calcium exchanger)